MGARLFFLALLREPPREPPPLVLVSATGAIVVQSGKLDKVSVVRLLDYYAILYVTVALLMPVGTAMIYALLTCGVLPPSLATSLAWLICGKGRQGRPA